MKFAGMVCLYNPTKEMIKNVEKYIDALDKVYLIDNSNIDNSKIIPKNKKIIYMPNHDNLGIAKALNIGAETAIKDGYKWLLTMDQDSKLTLDNLKKLEEFVENNNTKKVGIVSPYHNVETHEIKKDTDVEKMTYVMTSGNLLNLEIYKKINGFKDWLFIDLVDTEYCLNLNKNGYEVLRLNNVIMEHNLGDTKVYKFLSKKFICNNHNAIRRYYMVRNMYYLNDLYGNDYKEFCQFLKRVQKAQIRYIILFEKDKINKLKMMYKGYKDYKNNKKGRIEL